ncbi:MAG: pyridoxal phosphate-dependent decarboxylase family protein [Nocardioidaceae bacterium]
MTEPHDSTETARVSEVLARLGPRLDEFWRFEAEDRSVRDRAAWLPTFDRTLPAEGAGLDAVLAELDLAIRNGSRIADPGFSGFITTGATTAGIASAVAAAAAGAQRYTLHAFNALEWIGLRWLAEACGLPEEWEGVFSSGGSVANLIALGAARQATFEKRGVDVAHDGLPTGVVTRIYASTEAHRTIHRSAAVLGLGQNAVRELPTDARQRIDVHALDAALAEDIAAGVVPLAVVAIAGTTNTGAIDPIDDVLEVVRRHGAWLHVDGAYGLPAYVDPDVRPRLAGVAEADSAIVDPHKWLATGVGVAATYVRSPGVLVRAFAEGEAAYLEGSFSDDMDDAVSQFEEMGGQWADMSLELSAPPRGVHVWAVLREIGLDGLRARVSEHRTFARHLAATADEHPRLESLTDPELSVACIRYRPTRPVDDLDGLTTRLLRRLRRETPYAPSSTVVDGVLAIRPCYINPRTRIEHVDGLAEALVRLGDDETS